MRPPSRTLGVAFSDDSRRSRIAGAVVRDDGTLDGLAYESCTVGGTDSTDAVIDLMTTLDRPDVQHVCLAGIAPARFNLLDLHRLSETLDRPVYSVSYEPSPGLKPALREAFDGDTLNTRLATYRSLPDRRRLDRPPAVDDGTDHATGGQDAGETRSISEPLFVRAVGIDSDDAAVAVRSAVRQGFRRPEPVRIASIAASAHRDALA